MKENSSYEKICFHTIGSSGHDQRYVRKRYPWISFPIPRPPQRGSGLAAYIIQATGVGITTLSTFTITDDVHQVWTLYDPPGPDPAVTIQSEWVGNGTMTPHADDSYVIFGDQRIVGADPDAVTLETPKRH